MVFLFFRLLDTVCLDRWLGWCLYLWLVLLLGPLMEVFLHHLGCSLSEPGTDRCLEQWLSSLHQQARLCPVLCFWWVTFFELIFIFHIVNNNSEFLLFERMISFQGLLTLLMLITDDVYELINYTAFVESYFTAISVAGLLYLRYRDPKRSRPIKVNSNYQSSIFCWLYLQRSMRPLLIEYV